MLPAVEGSEYADTVERLVSEAIAAQTLAGFYAIGPGNKGLVRAVKGAVPKPVAIVHELTPVSRQGLQEGTIVLVLDQDTSTAVMPAVDIIRDLTEGSAIAAGSGKIRLNIYVRENIS